MPKQREVAAHAVAGLPIAQHYRQCLVAVAQPQIALGDDGAFHQHQRALAEAQEALIGDVEHRILKACAAAKPWVVGVAQRGVVIQIVVVPQARRGGCFPAKNVLAPPKHGLVDALFLQGSWRSLVSMIKLTLRSESHQHQPSFTIVF
jgi:hypothetical protein